MPWVGVSLDSYLIVFLIELSIILKANDSLNLIISKLNPKQLKQQETMSAI